MNGQIRSNYALTVRNPNNYDASAQLSWLNHIPRLRWGGGTSPGGANGFDFQGPGDTSYLRITSAGNVGIGTTNPAGKLDVAGSICLNGANCITSWPSSGGNWATSGSDSYVASGKLGVGTASPGADLSFGGTLARTIQVDRNTGAGTTGGGLTLQAGGAISGGSNYNGGTLTLASGVATGTGTSAIEFKTANAGASGATDAAPTTKMTILGNGNVGIGTTLPGNTLTVAGTIASTTGGLKFPDGTRQVSAAPVVGLVNLTDGPTISVNGSLGAVYKVTLSGNRTLANPTSLVPGAIYTFIFIQDATGGRTLTFDTNYIFPAVVSNPALSASPGATDSAQFVSDGTNLYYISGFATAAAPCLAPTNLSVAATINSSQVTSNLTWTNNSTNLQNNVVQRSADGLTNWISVVTVSAGSTSTSFVDSDLTTDSYYWRVAANCGLSGTSFSLARQASSSIFRT